MPFVTTDALGEEEPVTTKYTGEEVASTDAIGEEDPTTTMSSGEEDTASGSEVENPFGSF